MEKLGSHYWPYMGLRSVLEKHWRRLGDRTEKFGEKWDSVDQWYTSSRTQYKSAGIQNVRTVVCDWHLGFKVDALDFLGT